MVAFLSKVRKGLSKTRRTILGRFDESKRYGYVTSNKIIVIGS